MNDANTISTPSDLNQKLSIAMITDKDEENANIPYQEAVGSLLYLAQYTRPDIAFAVNDVSRFNSNFGQAHWTAVKRIMRYLKGTIGYKLRYTKNNDEIHGFVDSDWASDIDKRRSCTGYVFRFSGGAITWNSKRQSTIALSTTEAEYMAATVAAQEAIWLKQFYQEYQRCNQPIMLFCDNKGAIDIAKNDSYRARSKHIDIKHHFIREKLNEKTISLQYLSTDQMVADSLTKAVPKEKNDFCATEMGLYK
ncbi:secreted RxLR effector protein 161-like [Contarinia nasturtii]|uniref:secreted RxLR effector protein 161-like n=1 Tax=Contarinia nasturtii TaxID=265458 RepID=UPI0012D44FEB|nr:secreted RxLR effector protein 161-like [Contarinia nasturtii]